MTAPPSVASTTFASGDLAAGRFRILRFLARGGMGEVYEATDELLGIHVALKTLRAHVADDASALERFRREILFARQVTHPNVCRIFDVFHHRRTQDPAETPVTFLTMELLSGETLAERLRARGRMSTVEARPIVAQVVSALSAAHKAGIVHRDVKSGNVMLVPSADGTDRAVVTDFGLARAVDAGEASSTGGEMIGTSAYMAPEQVRGGTITPSADIYALGVVLYEMVTGTRPFSGESPVAVALQRLGEPPAAPSRHVPDLDPAWEHAILRCLEREPGARFATLEPLLQALTGDAGRPATARPRPLRLSWLQTLALGLALLVAFLAARRCPGSALPPAAPSRVPAPTVTLRRSVAVLGFRSLSGRPDAAWLSGALTEMLTTELAAGERLRTVPSEQVARMKRDVASAGEDSLAPETLAVIRGRLGADVVVLGSYLALGPGSGGQIRLDLRIRDTRAGETLAETAETGTETELLGLIARAGAWLRRSLGAEVDREAESQAARAALPANPEAARLYAEGLERLRLFEARAAKDLLLRAVAADPTYPLARLALADAWSALGYDQKAREQAQRAFESSARLSREERLLTEARYHEVMHQWDKALEIYRVLFGFFPDNLDYGLRLADVQTLSGHGKAALATLDDLRKLRGPRSALPQIDLCQASAAQSLSDFKRQRDASRSAAEKGARLGARLVVAAARRSEGQALMKLGDLHGASLAFEEAQREFIVAGDRRGAAQAMGSLAAVLWKRGELVEAMRKDEQALAVFDELGDRLGQAIALNHLGVLLQIRGDFAAARARYQRSLAIHRELGERQGLAAALIKLAELDAAGAEFTRALKGYEEARRVSDEIGAQSLVAFALARQAEVLATQGNLAGALRGHERALQIRERLGELGQVAESRLALAQLALEAGQPAEAEALAAASAAEFARHDLRDSHACAQGTLAEALALQGKVSQAQQAIGSAQALSANSQRPRVRHTVALATARVLLAAGRPSEVAAELAGLSAKPSDAGLQRLQLEARLLQGQAQLATGDSAAGRAELQRLEREARGRGFVLLARKARAAAAQRAP